MCESYQRAAQHLAQVADEASAEVCQGHSSLGPDQRMDRIGRQLDTLISLLPQMLLQVLMLSALCAPTASMIQMLPTRVSPVPSRVVPQPHRPRTVAVAPRPQLAPA